MSEHPDKCPKCEAKWMTETATFSSRRYECGSHTDPADGRLVRSVRCLRNQLDAVKRENERMRAALQRQITNVERWLETGEPADPAESKSIYEQMVEAAKSKRGATP